MGIVWSPSNIVTLLLGAAFTLYLLWWIASYIVYIIRLVWSDTHRNTGKQQQPVYEYDDARSTFGHRGVNDEGTFGGDDADAYYDNDGAEYDDDDAYYDDQGYPVSYHAPPPPPPSQSTVVRHRSARATYH